MSSMCNQLNVHGVFVHCRKDENIPARYKYGDFISMRIKSVSYSAQNNVQCRFHEVLRCKIRFFWLNI